MSKVILDGNLIDLEMITHISKLQTSFNSANDIFNSQNDDDDEDDYEVLPNDRFRDKYIYFLVYMVGHKNPIIVERKVINHALYVNEKEQAKTLSQFSDNVAKTRRNVSTMWCELTKRWSPTMTKFDDITVK